MLTMRCYSENYLFGFSFPSQYSLPFNCLHLFFKIRKIVHIMNKFKIHCWVVRVKYFKTQHWSGNVWWRTISASSRMVERRYRPIWKEVTSVLRPSCAQTDAFSLYVILSPIASCAGVI